MKSAIDYLRGLPFIDDQDLFKAISLCLWLVVDKGEPFGKSVKIAAKKNNIKPMRLIEENVRTVVPQTFFDSRKRQAQRSEGRRRRNMGLYENEKHFKSI